MCIEQGTKHIRNYKHVINRNYRHVTKHLIDVEAFYYKMLRTIWHALILG